MSGKSLTIVPLVTTVVAMLTASFAAAQHNPNHGGPAGEKPVTLLAGLGGWKHPIATKSPEAQKYFDQGLALLFGFNRYEALRSFKKAAELDPKAPMAYWGIAASLGPYVNMDGDPTYQIKESCDAVQAGLKLEANAIERQWLEAAEARCPDFADPQKYVAAMRILAARLPDDPDAQTLFAESLMIPVRWKWYASGKPAEGVDEAERVLQSVLRRYPQHAGANHYYIHAVESSPTPERAVPSAQRLMGITPAMGHMVHMPGHIWLVLGDFNNCVAVNEQAVAQDRKYFAQTGVAGSYGMYYVHNLHFLLYARTMQGRNAESVKAAKELLDGLAPMRAVPEMAEMIDAFGGAALMSQVRMQRWDEVLANPQPKTPGGSALWHAMRAIALVAKSDSPAAQREQAEFEKIAKTLPRDAQWGNNKLGSVLDFAQVAIAARLAPSPAKAVPLWTRAVEMQDALVYDEPPAWYYPLRESLGAATLLSGDAAGAEAVFREGLRRSPNNGRMLFGLLESLKAQKKNDAAVWVEREFAKAWQGADLKLSLKDL
jgi:tetratricopeptide (TPR) repeat protein